MVIVNFQVELTCTRNKMAEARVANTEGKLADYSQKLNKRTEKLNELHIKLKLRKDKMMEREERLRQFEKGENGSVQHTVFKTTVQPLLKKNYKSSSVMKAYGRKRSTWKLFQK